MTLLQVINYGVAIENRRYVEVKPLGIEIHRSIWGYNTVEDLKNTIF